MNSYGQNPLCRKSREIRNYCFSEDIMNSYGQNPLCRKSREIRNYCFSFNYALLKVIVAFSFNYAFLRTIVVFTDCIKLVVLFH